MLVGLNCDDFNSILQESKKLGKSSFMYAWVLDETPEERNRGITMDIAYAKLETDHRFVQLKTVALNDCFNKKNKRLSS